MDNNREPTKIFSPINNTNKEYPFERGKFPPYRGNLPSNNSTVRLGQTEDKHELSFTPSFVDPEWNKYMNVNKISNRQSRPPYTSINFWFENPSELFSTFDLIPNADMNNAERLNAMTRVIIIISAIMFAFKFPVWWIFLGLGMIIIIILWYIIKGQEELYADQIRRQREYLRKPILRPVNNIIHPINSKRYSVNNQPLRLVSF